ncbi:transmembrane BAX inhibitor motif containing 1a [Latimeria chalumnae]|uniref:transmembrane BAX inhibitor motif containing 1a n=1 Tax=Latimeria chalumnae TaxID=7897 RepID=UPI0006D92C11|nr:PREDICTED: protein lifeguard 3 [Latimeria chalumnae]|eukprot:XP_014351488.1 PREDICTED: protein lifeguard 3 [Latimeria chalumnae]
MSAPSAPPSYEDSLGKNYPQTGGYTNFGGYPTSEVHPAPADYTQPGGFPQAGGYPPPGMFPQPGGMFPQPGGAFPQPGGAFPQPGGAFPQAGGFPQSGFPPNPNSPMPPGFPPMPMIPPHMPLRSGGGDQYGTSHNADVEGFASGSWNDKGVRHAFIRKVYLILAVQLSVTVAVVAFFTFYEPVRTYVARNSAIYWVSYAIFIVVYFVLICCEGPRRRFPCNVILLTVFTLAMSYMTGTIASFYDTKSVFLCLGITVLVCIAVTVFCFQTKVDFTSCGGLFCVLGIVLFITGIITTIVLSFKYIPWLHMLYAGIGAVVFTLFLAYDTQLLLGNRKHSISPEEYVYAALQLYTDIVQIFIFLLQLFGKR